MTATLAATAAVAAAAADMARVFKVCLVCSTEWLGCRRVHAADAQHADAPEPRPHQHGSDHSKCRQLWSRLMGTDSIVIV